MYDGRVRTNKKWWQIWKPEFDRDLWRCQHCGEVYHAFLPESGKHLYKICVDG